MGSCHWTNIRLLLFYSVIFQLLQISVTRSAMTTRDEVDAIETDKCVTVRRRGQPHSAGCRPEHPGQTLHAIENLTLADNSKSSSVIDSLSSCCLVPSHNPRSGESCRRSSSTGCSSFKHRPAPSVVGWNKANSPIFNFLAGQVRCTLVHASPHQSSCHPQQR